MDKIIIINDNRIAEKLEKFILDNRKHIKLISDMDEVSLGQNPVLKEIIGRYEAKNKIRLIADNQVWFFKSGQVVRIEAIEQDVLVYLQDGKCNRVSINIDRAWEQLESFLFIRVDPRHIINVNYIAKFTGDSADTIYLLDGTGVPVSSEFRSSLLSILKRVGPPASSGSC